MSKETTEAIVEQAVMVNGWRVTWDGDRSAFVIQRDGVTQVCLSAVNVCVWCSTENGRDADVVRVLALRDSSVDQ